MFSIHRMSLVMIVIIIHPYIRMYLVMLSTNVSDFNFPAAYYRVYRYEKKYSMVKNDYNYMIAYLHIYRFKAKSTFFHPETVFNLNKVPADVITIQNWHGTVFITKPPCNSSIIDTQYLWPYVSWLALERSFIYFVTSMVRARLNTFPYADIIINTYAYNYSTDVWKCIVVKSKCYSLF